VRLCAPKRRRPRFLSSHDFSSQINMTLFMDRAPRVRKLVSICDCLPARLGAGDVGGQIGKDRIVVRSRSTITQSELGTLERKAFRPYVVRIPAVSAKFLIAVGTPLSGPPCHSSACRSASVAAIASSTETVMKARLRAWSLIRRNDSATTPTDVTSRLTIFWASSDDGLSVR
jgi:hypothetical protein